MDLLERAAESAERALERAAADVRWTSQGAYRYLRAPPCYAPDLTEPPSTRALAVLALALAGAGGAGGSAECGAGTLGLVAVNLAWFFRPGGTDLRAVALQPYAVLERYEQKFGRKEAVCGAYQFRLMVPADAARSRSATLSGRPVRL